jgi:hypothetical protein
VIINVGPDETYTFKFESLMASEMIAIKRATDYANKPQLWAGLLSQDPEAWQALVWVLRKRGGRIEKLSETDFPIGGCQIEFDEAESRRVEAALEGIDLEPEEKGEPAEFPTAASPGTTSGSPSSASTPGTTAAAPPS